MKKLILIISLCIFSIKTQAYTLQKYNLDLNYPWGMSWLDSTKLLITEKKISTNNFIRYIKSYIHKHIS